MAITNHVPGAARHTARPPALSRGGNGPLALLWRWLAGSPAAWLTRHQRSALAAIFGVGLVLRVVLLENIPNTVTADELDYSGNALEVITGQGPGLFGLDWTPQPALSLYLMVWSWRLFGMTLFAERLVSAVLTALAIIPFYFLTRRLVSVPSALLATLLFAAARWFLLFSRSGWNNGDIVLYMLLGAWALTLALERGQWRYWVGFGAALALLLYGYFAGRAIVLAFACYLVLALWWRLRGRDPGGWRPVLYGACLAAAVCLLLFLPEVPTILSNVALFNARTAAVSIFNQPLARGQSTLGLLLQQAWATFNSFFLMDHTLGSGRYKALGQSWLDPASALLYLAGLALAMLRGRSMALWWCLFLIPLGLTQLLANGAPDGARGLAAIAPMYVFVALSLEALARLRWSRAAWLQGGLIAAALLIAVVNVSSYVQWVDSPYAQAVRQPAVPVSGFYLWRDYQLARLHAHLGIMNASDYDALSPTAIVARIAADQIHAASAGP